MERTEEMGRRYKERREKLGLSLKEASNATSIRVHQIEAIESGDFAKLISPVYAQGFLTQYATYLGLEGDEELRSKIQSLTSSNTPQEFAYGIGTLESRGHPGAGVSWVPNMGWILAFGGVLAAAWFFARFLEVV